MTGFDALARDLRAATDRLRRASGKPTKVRFRTIEGVRYVRADDVANHLAANSALPKFVEQLRGGSR